MALVVVTDAGVDERTLQCQGVADRPKGADHARCFAAYLDAFPAGAQRAEEGCILLRIVPDWARLSDFNPGGGGVRQLLPPTPLVE